MNRLLLILFWGTIVFLSYEMTIQFIPNYVYSKFYKKVSENTSVQENVIRVNPAPNSESRLVVKPNPDFAYASMFFNLKDGPLRIHGDMPDSTYWSIALYQRNTTNFFVRNDRQFSEGHFDICLSLESGFSDSNFITTPSARGLLLIRLLILDRRTEHIEQMESMLKAIQVEPCL